MIDIGWIKEKAAYSEYCLSQHGNRRRQSHNLTFSELEEVLLNGRILEEYTYAESIFNCLVAGFTHRGKPVHVVCGELDNMLVITTVYIPTPPDYKIKYTKEEKMSKNCQFCGNTQFKKTKARHIHSHDTQFLIVNEVPCFECEYCGERYFQADVLKRIDEMFKEIHVYGKNPSAVLHVPFIDNFNKLNKPTS